MRDVAQASFDVLPFHVKECLSHWFEIYSYFYIWGIQDNQIRSVRDAKGNQKITIMAPIPMLELPKPDLTGELPGEDTKIFLTDFKDDIFDYLGLADTPENP